MLLCVVARIEGMRIHLSCIWTSDSGKGSTQTHETRQGQVCVPLNSAQELHGVAEVNPEIESGTCVPLPRLL